MQEIQFDNLIVEKSVVKQGGSVEFKEGSSIVVEKGENEAKIVVDDGETTDELTIPQKTGTLAIDEDVPFEKGSVEFSARQRQETGKENTASQPGSFAGGESSQALGKNSFAFGKGVIASNIGSHAEGGDNIKGATTPDDGDELLFSTAEGIYSHSEGAGHAIGRYSHAEGGGGSILTGDWSGHPTRSTAEGAYSHAEGSHTWAYGSGSHAEGDTTKAQGKYSHSEGWQTKAIADYSHVEGHRNTTNGNISHAEGYNNIANGEASHVEGKSNTINGAGEANHIEGKNNKITTTSGVNPRSTHIEGESNEAQGNISHAEGYKTVVKGECSHTEGSWTTTSNNFEHAQGRYNLSHTSNNQYPHASNTIHSIGIGTSDSNRKNAVEVMQNGKVYVKDVGNYDGTNSTESTTKDLATILAGMQGQLEDVSTVKTAAETAKDSISSAANIGEIKTALLAFFSAIN